MKTDALFQKNLENRILTGSMLEAALYSVNKRAKNCRDEKKKYRSYDPYNNWTKYEEKERYYYQMKDIMLSVISPICIHKVKHKFIRRSYDMDDDDYNPCFSQHRIDSFYKHDDIIEIPEVEDDYFLFYKTAHNSFHSPIDENVVEGYGLSVVELDSLVTTGHQIQELASVPFCRNIVDLIKSGTYQYIKDMPEKNAKMC